MEYVQPVSRLRSLARRHGFDVLIVLAAVESALEVAAPPGRGERAALDACGSPRPATALLVPAAARAPALPFAAPAAVWLLAAALSFVDGRLVAVRGGHLRRRAWPRRSCSATSATPCSARARAGDRARRRGDRRLQRPDPRRRRASSSLPVLFAIAWLAGFALRERAAAGRGGRGARDAGRAGARGGGPHRRGRGARADRARAARHRRPRGQRDGAPGRRRPAPAPRRRSPRTRRRCAASSRPAARRSPRCAACSARMRRDDDDVELAPQPGLDGARARCSTRSAAPACRCGCTSTASRSRCRAALDLSAYRIVQEGLTNALKHARAEPRRRDRPLRARRAADRGARRRRTAPPASDGLGHGLVGIRERVKIYGGEMTRGRARAAAASCSARASRSAATRP